MQSRHRGNGETIRAPLSETRVPRFAFESDSELESDGADTRRIALGTREIDGIARRAEPSARGSEDLQLASVPHALFVIGATGHIDYANALAEALVGYTRAELFGQSFDRIIADAEAAIAKSSREPRVRFIPAASGASAYHRTGRLVPVSVVLCPDANGRVIALVTPVSAVEPPTVVDESAIAELVHDFKNPLSTIALEMCLLEDKIRHDDAHQLNAVVARVTRNIEYMDRLVQDLLDSSAMADGQLALQRRPTELRGLLTRVIERGVSTRDRPFVFLEARSPITVSVDELRIERVVANLLHNALKYAPRASWIVVRLEQTAGVVRVSVVDSGPGITTSEQAYIFDKYRRIPGGRTREGNGLGLYVAKQIIAAHGGRIGVESVHGVGSQFFFELPMS